MEIKIKPDDLVTVPKAAKQLGRPWMTLYRWIGANKIVSIKLGGILFITKSEVERLKNLHRPKERVRRLKCSKDKIIKLLSKSDITYVEIGKRVGVSKQWVHQVAKEVGVTRKRQPPHYRSDITVDRVLDCYHEDLLVKDIAQTLNCEVSTVRKRLREAGIGESECRSRSMKLDWRGDTHCRDDVTIEGVLELYHSNLLIKDIAQTLGCNQVTVRKRLRVAGISKGTILSRKLRRRTKKQRQSYGE